MEKELLEFISVNNLSPFGKTKVSRKQESIFKTKDARDIYSKVVEQLSGGFSFQDTKNLFQLFGFTQDMEEIKKRQDFFAKLEKKDNSFLFDISIPRNWWKPKYGVLVVTEDEKTFGELQKLNAPVQFISAQQDLSELENYDLVQVVDCQESSAVLERLPQSIFLDSADDAYLERHLESLSGWKKNIEILSDKQTSSEISKTLAELVPLLKLLDSRKGEKLTREKVEKALEDINDLISREVEKMNISGTALLSILGSGKMTPELGKIVESAIKQSNLPEQIFISSIPVRVEEEELDKIIKKQDTDEFTNEAEIVKKNSESIRKIPKLLEHLERALIYFDFTSSLSKNISDSHFFPELSQELYFSEAENVFLDDAQPVSFILDGKNRCSMLTGANSGGKTTLLEHIIQLVTFFQLGLPVRGKVKIPIFSEIYYFAKTKGSASKGAFETLLTQMASIKPGARTLILADEIEAVTEPGVAGKIISATAEYFLGKGCFLVIATHLGVEVQKNLPCNARIDGIEAKGLDENNELIVDHNPVLGKLANSTPELIIEKMARNSKEDYFKFLQEKVKSI
jgi:DNA mismatch repair protein MutS2